jgi:hypothetical protein
MHPVAPPAAEVLRMAPATTVGGAVRGEAGDPVAGAAVTVGTPETGSERANFISHLGTDRIDERGRWRRHEAPGVLAEVGARAGRPRHRHARCTASHDLNTVTALHQDRQSLPRRHGAV